jgi:ABC-type sugar transport system ATPase subunit
MSALELSKIWSHAGRDPVLDNVSMHVAKGEFVSILGPRARASPPCSGF